MKKGKLIVLDGPDGSGKQTQKDELVTKLIALGYDAEGIDFPRYYTNFAGKLIGKFQCDEAMNFSKENAYLASMPYAIDRFESKPQMDKWLAEGKIIISDRYVSANQLHQGGKFENPIDRKNFLDALDYLEYEIFKIPRPDLTILLDVPTEISVQLMIKKALSKDKDKEYSQGEIDLVEKDAQYQLGARSSGITMLSDPNWAKVECSYDGKTMREIQSIHEEVLELTMTVL